MLVATVFSIEEFAVYDGPGIRMTVFMKGCPLSCSWCHNPEGQSFGVEYMRSPNGCVGCGACVRKENGKEVLTAESVLACKRGLVRKSGEEYSVENLCDKILKNAKVLALNGGGVTFSGGEPLSSFSFVRECMKILKGKVHLAIQTSGFASEEVFREAISLSDYFLYDLKIMDESKHKDYCGQSNELILKNYRTLASSGKEFITRVPLIPTVTDTPENLTAIAKFMSENGVTKVELLPYNKFAGSKYKNVLKEYNPRFDESVPSNPRAEIFEAYEISVKVM